MGILIGTLTVFESDSAIFADLSFTTSSLTCMRLASLARLFLSLLLLARVMPIT